MLIREAPKNVVLIKSLEQGGELAVPPLGGVNLSLDVGNLLRVFSGIFAGNVLGEQLFLFAGA